MVKLIIAGVWGIIAAFCGAYFLHDMVFPKSTSTADDKHEPVIEQVSTELTGVPIVSNNEVQGYIVVRVSSLVDTSLLPSKEVGIIPFLTDAAFRASYEFAQHGFVKIRASDMDTVTKNIKDMTNKKLGKDAVVSVNVEQFNFVRRDEIRGNMMKSN